MVATNSELLRINLHSLEIIPKKAGDILFKSDVRLNVVTE